MTTTTAIFVGGALDGTIRSLEGRPQIIATQEPKTIIPWYKDSTPLPDPWRPRRLLHYRDTGTIHPDGYRVYRLER